MTPNRGCLVLTQKNTAFYCLGYLGPIKTSHPHRINTFREVSTSPRSSALQKKRHGIAIWLTVVNDSRRGEEGPLLCSGEDESPFFNPFDQPLARSLNHAFCIGLLALTGILIVLEEANDCSSTRCSKAVGWVTNWVQH